MKQITIALADDHHIVRQGLRAVLAAEPDFTVVGDAGDGAAAVALVLAHAPQVLVLDLMMPGTGGLSALAQVRQRAPRTQVVVLSMHANEAYVVEALRAGALGYVLKGSESAVLIAAIRSVAAGQRVLGPPLNEAQIAAYVDRTSAVGELDPLATLTAREHEVLLLVAQGHSSSEIADRLHLSARTVETYRAHVLRKLNLHNHTDMVRFAIRRGLIDLGET